MQRISTGNQPSWVGIDHIQATSLGSTSTSWEFLLMLAIHQSERSLVPGEREGVKRGLQRVQSVQLACGGCDVNCCILMTRARCQRPAPIPGCLACQCMDPWL